MSHFDHPSVHRAARGYRTRESVTLTGRSIALKGKVKPRHPWFTSAAWSPNEKQWVCTVDTGFVNETCPVWRTTIEAQKKSGAGDFGINPLTGQPFFSASVFSQGPQANTQLVSIDIPLYLTPSLDLSSWRALGIDGDGPVPDYFAQFGVPGAATALTPEEIAAGATPQPPAIPAKYRLLRSCDVWIQQPRLALTSDITLQPGPATGISNVTQTLGVRSSSDVLRIFTGQMPEQSQAFDPLAGTYEEPTWDQLLIATVFLLSPINAALGSAPDGTWQPFVRHSVFWHLAWGQPGLVPLPGDPGTPFIPPLAAGAAQLVINFLSASLNDMTQQALNLLLGHSLAGSFWTITGGGHDSTSQATTLASSVKTGLNKSAFYQQQSATDAAKRRALRLEPAFPYSALPIPLSFLPAQ